MGHSIMGFDCVHLFKEIADFVPSHTRTLKDGRIFFLHRLLSTFFLSRVGLFQTVYSILLLCRKTFIRKVIVLWFLIERLFSMQKFASHYETIEFHSHLLFPFCI